LGIAIWGGLGYSDLAVIRVGAGVLPRLHREADGGFLGSVDRENNSLDSHRVKDMLKRIMVWTVIICLLTALSAAAQPKEHLTWAVKELSARVSLEERNDGLPVYVPKTPNEGVALYVDDIARVDETDGLSVP